MEDENVHNRLYICTGNEVPIDYRLKLCSCIILKEAEYNSLCAQKDCLDVNWIGINLYIHHVLLFRCVFYTFVVQHFY